jgi:transposase InsO family protein
MWMANEKTYGAVVIDNGDPEKDVDRVKRFLAIMLRPSYSVKDLVRCQKKNYCLRLLRKYVEERDPEEKLKVKAEIQKCEKLEEAEKKWINRNLKTVFLSTEKVLLRKKPESEVGDWRTQIVLPPTYWIEIMHAAHDLHGHMGETKTLDKIRNRYDWPGMQADVSIYVQSCVRCQSAKGQHHIMKHKLKTIVSDRKNQILQIDFEKLTKVYDGHKTYVGLLVMVDHFTKYCMAAPLESFDSKGAIDAVLQHWIYLFGYPETIQSDQGSQFEAELFQDFCKLFGITKVRSTAYHPESQGLVERQNQTLCKMLRCAMSRQSEWPGMVREATFAYNCTVHATTGYTPNMMHLGDEAPTPMWFLSDALNPQDQYEPKEIDDFIKRKIERIPRTWELARTNMRQSQLRQKRNYDARIKKGIKYEEGDYVMCFTDVVSRYDMKKLQPQWRGPYRINKVHEDGIFYYLSSGKRAHYNRLKRYFPRPSDMAVTKKDDDLISIFGDGEEYLEVTPAEDAEDFSEDEPNQDEYRGKEPTYNTDHNLRPRKKKQTRNEGRLDLNENFIDSNNPEPGFESSEHETVVMGEESGKRKKSKTMKTNRTARTDSDEEEVSFGYEMIGLDHDEDALITGMDEDAMVHMELGLLPTEDRAGGAIIDEWLTVSLEDMNKTKKPERMQLRKRTRKPDQNLIGAVRRGEAILAYEGEQPMIVGPEGARYEAEPKPIFDKPLDVTKYSVIRLINPLFTNDDMREWTRQADFEDEAKILVGVKPTGTNEKISETKVSPLSWLLKKLKPTITSDIEKLAFEELSAIEVGEHLLNDDEWPGVDSDEERKHDDEAVPPIEDDDEPSWEQAVASFGPYRKRDCTEVMAVRTTHSAKDDGTIEEQRDVLEARENRNCIDRIEVQTRRGHHRNGDHEEEDMPQLSEWIVRIMSIEVKAKTPRWLTHEEGYIWNVPGPRLLEIASDMNWNYGYLSVFRKDYSEQLPQKSFCKRRNVGDILAIEDDYGTLNILMVTSKHTKQGTDLYALREALGKARRYLEDRYPGTRTVYVPRLGTDGEFTPWHAVMAVLEEIVTGRTTVNDLRIMHPPQMNYPIKPPTAVRPAMKKPKTKNEDRPNKGLIRLPKGTNIETMNA